MNPLPAETDIVQLNEGSRVFKMNTTFGVIAASNKKLSTCAQKSAPGNFLVVHIDGSLSALKKSEYSKYFPKQPDVKQEGTTSNKALKNKDYLTNVKKNS